MGTLNIAVKSRMSKLTYYIFLFYTLINSYCKSNTPNIWNSTTSLPMQLKNHSVEVVNNYIFVIGGDYGLDHINMSTKVYRAKISEDYMDSVGPIANWETDSELPYPRSGHCSVLYKYGDNENKKYRIYIIGGSEGNGERISILYADINLPGDDSSEESGNFISEWKATTGGANQIIGENAANLFNLSQFGCAIRNDFFYIVGGQRYILVDEKKIKNVFKTVLYAKISIDGSVGWNSGDENGWVEGFWQEGKELDEERMGLIASFVDDKLYIFGGENSGGEQNKKIQYAKINKSGSTSEWKTTDRKIKYERRGFSLFKIDKIIYLAGGWNIKIEKFLLDNINFFNSPEILSKKYDFAYIGWHKMAVFKKKNSDYIVFSFGGVEQKEDEYNSIKNVFYADGEFPD